MERIKFYNNLVKTLTDVGIFVACVLVVMALFKGAAIYLAYAGISIIVVSIIQIPLEYKIASDMDRNGFIEKDGIIMKRE